jgi:hypothetical protein
MMFRFIRRLFASYAEQRRFLDSGAANVDAGRPPPVPGIVQIANLDGLFENELQETVGVASSRAVTIDLRPKMPPDYSFK